MVLPLLAAAGISAIGSLIGGSQQSKAAKKAAEIQAASEAAALAARKEAAAQVVSLQQPGVDAWGRGLNALTGRLGLPSQGVDSFNAKAYMDANPDVAARAQELAAQGDVIGPGKQWSSAEDWAAYQYKNTGQAEGRAAPQGAGGVGSPTGTNSLTGTAVFGNTADPGAFSYGVEDYKASPAYAYELDQGLKSALSHSSATGALQSGATLKALQDRGQQIAYKDFAGERAVARGIYESDRGYLTDRNDRGTDDLFRYTGVGQSAVNTTSNALTGVGEAGASAALGTGEAKAGNALQQGNIWGGVANDIAGSIAGLIKPKAPTTGGTNWTTKYALAGGS